MQFTRAMNPDLATSLTCYLTYLAIYFAYLAISFSLVLFHYSCRILMNTAISPKYFEWEIQILIH